MLIYGYIHYTITVPSKRVACQENTAGILFYKWIPETFTDMHSQIILRLDGLGAPPIELVQLGTESRKARLEVVSIHTNVHTEGALASRGGLV